MKQYDVGDKPEITATFRTSAGVLTNPTTVTFITRTPAGVETATTSANAAITNPSTGVYVYTFPDALTEEGIWTVRAKGNAGLVAAVEGSFEVIPSGFDLPAAT